MAKAATVNHNVTLELSSVHDRLSECEQRNGGCNISSWMMCFFFMFRVKFQDHRFTYFYKC